MYEYAGNPLYNPMVNPYLGVQRPFQQQPRQEVVKVNGENGARAFPLGANSSALLLDESGQIVWLVTSDGAGYKSVHPFDISPHEAAPAPDYSDLESRITKLERMMDDAKHTATSERRQSADYNAYAAAPTDDRHDQERRQSASTYAADDAAEQSGSGKNDGLHQAAWRRSESGV